MIKNEDWKVYGSFNDVTIFDNSINSLTNQSLYINENGTFIKKIRLLGFGMKDIYLAFEDSPYLENKIKEYDIVYKKSGSKYGEIHILLNEETLDNTVKYLLEIERTLNSENIIEILRIVGLNSYKNYWLNQANLLLNELKKVDLYINEKGNMILNNEYLEYLEKYINNLNYNEIELKNFKLFLVKNLLEEDPNKAFLFIEEKEDKVLFNKTLFYQEILNSNITDEREHLKKLISYGVKGELWDEVKQYFNKLCGKSFGEDIDVNLKNETEVILFLADYIRNN